MAPDDPHPPLCEAAPWRELAELIHAARNALPVSAWKPVLAAPIAGVQTGQDSRDLPSQAADLVAADGSDAMRAVAQWSESGQWPTMPQRALYYADQMLERAGAFVESAIILRNGQRSTIFPFPNAAPQSVFLWLLTEWWRGNEIFRRTDAVLSPAPADRESPG